MDESTNSLYAMLAEQTDNFAAVSESVPLKTETEEVSLVTKNTKSKASKAPAISDDPVLVSGDEKSEETQGTKGTFSNDGASSGSPAKMDEGTQRTRFDIGSAIDPLHDADDSQIERLSFDELDMPCFIVKDDWFDLGGKRKPGVWYCYETEGTERKPPAQYALFICSPLYIEAVSNTENGQYFGRLLKFRDTLGHWRTWSMPMEILRGSCEELRGELLAAGVEIDPQNRNRLAGYL